MTRMKTTIDLPDQLAQDAKAFAREHGLTLRELVERGLREQLRRSRVEPYEWEPVVAGRPGDPMPPRPPHEYAYEE